MKGGIRLLALSFNWSISVYITLFSFITTFACSAFLLRSSETGTLKLKISAEMKVKIQLTMICEFHRFTSKNAMHNTVLHH